MLLRLLPVLRSVVVSKGSFPLKSEHHHLSEVIHLQLPSAAVVHLTQEGIYLFLRQ